MTSTGSGTDLVFEILPDSTVKKYKRLEYVTSVWVYHLGCVPKSNESLMTLVCSFVDTPNHVGFWGKMVTVIYFEVIPEYSGNALALGDANDTLKVIGQSPSYIAAGCAHENVLKKLIDAGTKSKAFSELVTAAISIQNTILNRLFDVAGNPHLDDGAGRTALHYPCASRDVKVVKELL
ncbi:hypothetical protein BDD12DRAFT_905134 [Trichophaea hybrida]|nr:hypothetical protein BDD12DRAFT_905134 [Trichophaea hybrida]